MARVIRLDIVEGKPRTIICAEAIENGLFVEIKGRAENAHLGAEVDYEAYEVELAKANTKRGALGFHASVCNMYDERLREQDFVLEAGKPGRAYQLVLGDIVTIPMIDGVAVGNELVLADNGLLAVGSDGLFVVEEINAIIPGYEKECMVIRVIAN